VNTFKTALLLTALTLLLVLIGRSLFGTGGMLVALAFAVLGNFGAYWWSDKLALSMAGALEVSYQQAPELHRLVEQLASYARLPKPRVYVVESPTPNAFATGRDPQHAAVAVTTGILRLLSRDELAGVIAHELAHVRNRDTLIAAVAATVAGAITTIAHIAQWGLMLGGFGGRDDDEQGGLLGGLLLILVAPLVAALLQLAISRSREFEADATGARIVGNPDALANALEKLEYVNQRLPMQVNPATAPLFIVSPFRADTLLRLFSTHPPVAERIRRLRAMRGGLAL